jgi:hypothetical protein
MHCGAPMVHNSFTGEWECADAYFTLLDEGALSAHKIQGESDWSPQQLTDRDVPRDLVETLRHWRASRTPDGWSRGWPLPKSAEDQSCEFCGWPASACDGETERCCVDCTHAS